MPPTRPVKEQPLEKRLKEQIIPWVNAHGIAHVFIAQPSWHILQESGPELPPGATATHKPLRSKRVRSRIIRTHGKLNIEQDRWPQDHLLSARVPKLCFVTEGPVAFQIADYVLHCTPGHAILLPPDTPNPDGTLAVLDMTRDHHNVCELFMLMPRQGSLSCWTSRQTYDARGNMTRHSDAYSILQSQVTPCLQQLVEETKRRQLHWQSVCSCLLRTAMLLLHRELRELPVIYGGDELLGDPKELPPPDIHAITRAEEYIRTNLRWPLTIDQVARAVYLSRTTFTAQFRQRTGKTFIEYVNDCRFEEACRLLQNTDLSIHHIGLQIGLQPRSLHLLIQRRTGISPTALRHRYQQSKING